MTSSHIAERGASERVSGRFKTYLDSGQQKEEEDRKGKISSYAFLRQGKHTELDLMVAARDHATG